MCPGGAVVGDAVAAVIWGNEGLLLTSVEFALAWVDDVGVLRFCTFVRNDGAIGVHDRVASHSVPCRSSPEEYPDKAAEQPVTACWSPSERGAHRRVQEKEYRPPIYLSPVVEKYPEDRSQKEDR